MMPLFCLAALLVPARWSHAQKINLIDANATAQTKALSQNLKKLSRNHILFGHQHATEYGHGWSGEENRSDVKSVTGSHPAVIGVDFSGLSGRPETSIEKTKESLRKTITDTYNRGGVVTVAWRWQKELNRVTVLDEDPFSDPVELDDVIQAARRLKKQPDKNWS